MKRGTGNMNKLVAALLVLTAIVLVIGIGMNIYSMSVPTEKASGTTGEVKLYVSGEAEPTSTTGKVSVVVNGP